MKHSIFAILAIVLLVCGLTPLSAGALEEAESESSGLTLIVELERDNTPLPNALFSLYRVGDFEETGAIVLDDEYAARFSVSDIHDQKDWDDVARDMAAYVKDSGTVPLASGYTSEDGRVVFDEAGGLVHGVYLVVGDDVDYQETTYSSLPFLTTIPSWDPEEEVWRAVTVAQPKPGKRTPDPGPDPTPTPTPGPDPDPAPSPSPDPSPGADPTPSPDSSPSGSPSGNGGSSSGAASGSLPKTGDSLDFLSLLIGVCSLSLAALIQARRHRAK